MIEIFLEAPLEIQVIFLKDVSCVTILSQLGGCYGYSQEAWRQVSSAN